MPNANGGYQPRTTSSTSRRADFDLLRRIIRLERDGGGGGGGEVPAARRIDTTAPLTGGGDLSADRTLGVTDFTTIARGTVPASGGGTANYLRADGTWATPPDTTGTSGTIILNGTGPPAAGIGNIGDYYEDTLNGVLYGPKGPGQASGTGLILNEPFNDFTTAPWVIAGTPTIVAGRTGTAASTGGTGNYITYSIPTGNEYITLGMAFRTSVVASGLRRIVMFYSDAGVNAQFQLRYDGNGAITFERGDGTLITQSANGLIAINTWYYIELQARCHDTLGFGTVRLNGTTVITATNADTHLGGTALIDRVQLGPRISATTILYDDLYLKTGSSATLEGDITVGVPAWPVAVRRLPDNAVTNAQLADMPASTIKGNNTGATADPVDLTVAQVITLLGLPRGRMGTVAITTNSAAVTATTVLTGSQITFTTVTGRRYHAHFKLTQACSVVGAEGRTHLELDGVAKTYGSVFGGAANRGYANQAGFDFIGDGASHTWQLSYAVSSGTGTTQLWGQTNMPILLAVDDVGV